jgi:molybdate transport system regulatory protein
MPKAQAGCCKVRFRIDFGDACSIGPGKVDLLQAIGATGSLSQAGRYLGMSYRRAWLLLDSLNSSFGEPVVATTTGGKSGGGAQLTSFGEALVSAYRDLEKLFDEQAAKKMAAIGVAPKSFKGVAMRTPLVKSQAPRRVRAKKSARTR